MKHNLLQILHVMVYRRLEFDYVDTLDKVCDKILMSPNCCADNGVLCYNCPFFISVARKIKLNYIEVSINER